MTVQRISLVLGSGGARGLAHIGAIRCLEAKGYEISYISGSSIGALIGGIYAAKEGQVLVDGGLINPVPIAPTLNDDTACTIAVDLNGHAEQLQATEPDVVKATGSLDFRNKISKFVDELRRQCETPSRGT